MIVEQGDLVEVNFNPTYGREPQKRRPALVVSVGYFNNVLSNLTVVCPITSTNNGHPLHVPIVANGLVYGCVCLEQVRAIDLDDPRRGAVLLNEAMDEETMSRVLEGLGAIFGI